MSFNNMDLENGVGYSLVENGWEPVQGDLTWVRKPSDSEVGLISARMRKIVGDTTIHLRFDHNRIYQVWKEGDEANVVNIKSLQEIPSIVNSLVG